MIYNASIQLDAIRAREKVNHLITRGVTFKIEEKRKKRSISQNSYLHLLFSWFGIETGYNAEEVKQEIFKRIVNPQIFYQGEGGKLNIERWRSTAELDTNEMTEAIERFRNYATMEAGIYLPEPRELALLQEIERQIENHKEYL